MTDSRDLSKELQGQIVETVRKSQDTIIDAFTSWAVKPYGDVTKSWAEAAQKLVPQLPNVAAITDQLPKPVDLVDNVYDFAERLLATRREFAHKLLDATAPLAGYPKK